MSAYLPATSGLCRPEHKDDLVLMAKSYIERSDGTLRLFMPDGVVIDLTYVPRRVNCWHFVEVAS